MSQDPELEHLMADMWVTNALCKKADESADE
jgi:hypothetical protein